MANDKDVDFPEERKLAEEGGYLKEYESFQNLKTNKSKATKLRIATFCGACLGSTWYLLVHLTPVTGSSMSPTALDGGRVLAIAFMPWETPQKGQIVQIRIPEVILKKYPNPDLSQWGFSTKVRHFSQRRINVSPVFDRSGLITKGFLLRCSSGL